VVWSKKSDRSFDDFTKRLAPHYLRLAYRGYNFKAPK